MTQKILIVDDEADLELLVRQRFRKQIKEGLFEFVFAANGKEALEKLEDHQDIHMLMTDINMPEMDGLTLLDKLKPLNRPIKAVVVSAYGDLQNIRTAMNRGAFDFLTKPVDFNDFEVTIYKTRDELNFIIESLEARKELDQEKLERIRAEEKERMEKQFLANMSHEIRTPLNAIQGMTRLLLMKDLSDESRGYLENIRKSCDNLIVIINDILDLSKIQAGKVDFEKIPFHPSESLQLVYNTLRFKSEDKKLSLVTHLDPDVPPTLAGDPTRLNQILINLAGNAIKFTESGSVTIHCSLQNAVSGNVNSVELKFTVTDTGIGMTPEQLSKVFESFTQASSDTTRKYGGTGLGLTISKQLVELQGGRISVQSEFGKGTVFSFFIPYEIANEELNLLAAKTSAEEAKKKVSGTKILLAEDNEFNQIVATELLKAMAPGVEIDVAENGRIAVQKVSEKNYDVILMDIQMPEMDGIEAITKIRESKNTVPIIVMTAGVMKDEIGRCVEAGAEDFVPKPMNPDELIEKIAQLVKK